VQHNVQKTPPEEVHNGWPKYAGGYAVYTTTNLHICLCTCWLWFSHCKQKFTIL